MGSKGIIMDVLKISDSFYFDFCNGELNINHDDEDIWFSYDVVTKEKAKEIIEFLTKFVEGE